MLDIIVITFVGWPAMIASLLAWLAGLATKRFALVIAAGIIVLPFAFFYFGGSLGSRWLGLILPLGHFGSAFAMRQNKMLVAWLLLAPYALLLGWLAFVVLTQNR